MAILASLASDASYYSYLPVTVAIRNFSKNGDARAKNSAHLPVSSPDLSLQNCWIPSYE